MFDRTLGPRVDNLEQRFTTLGASVDELRSDVGGLGGKIDKLVDGLSSTGQRVNERAVAVKDEIRAESAHRVRQIVVVVGGVITLCGGVAGVVQAIVGPYKQKLDQTAEGQSADTVAIAAVREVLAQQGAGIGRTQAAIDIARENGKVRDAELREHDQDLAYQKGFLAARVALPGR